jgi:hypothetical protein
MFAPKICAQLVVTVFVIIGFLHFASFAVSAGSVDQSSPHGVAIKGYDPVAYFTENRALKGSNDISYPWNDAIWHFTSAEHRALFAENPERYAPQFGGHCASGLSKGKVVAADPEEWTIVDGKLYLNYNRSARDAWRQNKKKMIEAAEKNWDNIKK